MKSLYPNPETMRERYFIFLDIDGTLIDFKYGQRARGPFFNFGENTILNPESIEALNILIDSLEQKYDTSLVITSGRRKNLHECVKNLYDNGLKYDKPITCTPLEDGRRGQKIIDCMMTYSSPKLPTAKKFVDFILKRYADQGYKNYVVLENDASKIRYEIPPKRRIITNEKCRALQPYQVEKYLKANNIPIKLPEDIAQQKQ
ncbi:MAG: hypothetical protein IKJ33_01930 [Clostridia bacterium]|nr:hypothetical protein [Clostridia bacterium]